MKKTTAFIVMLLLSISTGFAQRSVMDFYKARVKALQAELRAKGDSNAANEPDIITRDVVNGFISYNLRSMGNTIGWENMGYFIAANGKKFALIAEYRNAGTAVNTDRFNFYELVKGQLVERTQVYLPDQMKNRIETLMKNRLEGIAKQVQKNTGTEGQAIDIEYMPFGTHVEVPRKGTTIRIGYREVHENTDNFYVVAELVFNKATGNFTLVEK